MGNPTYDMIVNKILCTSTLITGAIRTTTSKAMLHWLAAVLLVQQVPMNLAIELNATWAWKPRQKAVNSWKY